VLSSKGTEGSKSEIGNFGVEIQTAVRAELEMMLKAPHFAQSHRCKDFLSYVVLQTLSGSANHLKERTIGISVFGRATDYDTGDDSIVRVTANEVRKRIDQFYRESRVAHTMQIELPKGAYVPEFRIQPLQRVKEIERDVAPDSSHQATVEGESGATSETPSLVVGSEVAAKDQSPLALIGAHEEPRFRRGAVFALLLVLLLCVGATIFMIWRDRTQQTGPQVWEAFLHSNTPVLICVDTHDLHLPNPASSSGGQKFVDLVLHKQIISLDDAAVISSMAAMLGKKGIPFRVVGAEQTSLTEFRRQPVILVGAIDNIWTIRLSQSLRYRIEVANPPGSGSDKEPIASIVDSQHAESAPWSVDLSIPFGAWKSDYAILARTDDTTTGVPVLIEAGLGNPGSVTASELITSGALERQLKSDPLCKGKANFEAVVGTAIIDTKPGPPHVLRLNCW